MRKKKSEIRGWLHEKMMEGHERASNMQYFTNDYDDKFKQLQKVHDMSDTEWVVGMSEDEMVGMEEKESADPVPKPYFISTSSWDMTLDPDDKDEAKEINETIQDVMKRAAKSAVKASSGKAYIYKLIGVVEQTNYEALVKAEMVDDTIMLEQATPVNTIEGK